MSSQATQDDLIILSENVPSTFGNGDSSAPAATSGDTSGSALTGDPLITLGETNDSPNDAVILSQTEVSETPAPATESAVNPLMEGIELNNDSSSESLLDFSGNSGESSDKPADTATSTEESPILFDLGGDTASSETKAEETPSSDISFDVGGGFDLTPDSSSEKKEETPSISSDSSDISFSLESDSSSSEISFETSESSEPKVEEPSNVDLGGISVGNIESKPSFETSSSENPIDMNTILEKTISELKSRQESIDSSISGKKSEIDNLNAQIKDLKGKVSTLEKEIKALETENSNIESNVSQLNGMKSKAAAPVSSRTRAHNSKKVAIK